MVDAESTGATYDRLRKGRDLVRKTALLLSGAEPLDALFDRLAALLADFVDASIVLVATGSGPEARIAYVYSGGSGGAPDDGTVRPGSSTEAVLLNAEVRLYRRVEDWPNQNLLSLGGRALEFPQSAIFVPILFGGTPVGALSVQSLTAGAYDEEDAALLETCALYLGARIHDERQSLESAQLERLASTDALTGLPNRRAFDERLAREWRRCARGGEPLGIAMLDVDYFKGFNDAYGHVAGDTCLRQVAQAIGRCLKRPGDLAARFGGEEFALVLPGTDAAGTVALCEEICSAVRALGIPHQGSTLAILTASIGAFSIVPRTGDDPRNAVAIADTLLYRAKSEGRNRISAEGHSSQAPVARAQSVARHNLPPLRSAFVGRSADLARIVDGLRRGRMVTVAGPGGVGKTRLAIQAASALLEAYGGGVWFVDLAPLADPALVAATVAAAAGIRASVGGDPLVALVEQLRPQRVLLVIDNCEHVIAHVARVCDVLLDGAPEVRLLATSREPLRIAGEAVHRLAPLDEASSIELFCARAREADRQFDPAADPRAIASICGRLDGIALAIELAAARVREAGPSSLLALIDDRLRQLGGDAEPPRHRTLRALIDWSYGLLSQREREIFRRLGTFAGSFSVEAAGAVAVAGAHPWEAADAVAELVEKSMVVQVDAERFRLLDSMAIFARAELDASGEREAACAGHAAYFALCAQEARVEYDRLTEAAWLGRCERDLDNFRAAMDWSARHDCDLLARIVAALGPFWAFAGLDLEGYERAESALRALGERAAHPQFAGLWVAVASSADRLFKTRRSLETAETALALARTGGDERRVAEAMKVIGDAHHRLGGDPVLAQATLKEATTIFRRLGCGQRAANALTAYANSLTRSGNLDEARAALVEAASLARRSGWVRTQRDAEVNLAEIEFALGNVARACAIARDCAESYRNSGARLTLSNALANCASYLAVAGEAEEAAEKAREAIEIAMPFEAEAHVAIGAQALALADALRGSLPRAAMLLGFVDAAYERRGAEREPTEATVRARILAEIEARDGDVAREIALGRTLDLEGVCRLAMGS